MPAPWRPRIRHRFGHPEALDRLLARLESAPRAAACRAARRARPWSRCHRAHGRRRPQPVGRPQPRRDRRPLSRKAGARRRPIPPATLKLLRDYLAISGPALQSLDPHRNPRPRRPHRSGAAPRNPSAVISIAWREASVSFDASFSPRLDYYTGIVFEMTGPDGEILASGGQYDRLLERLGAAAPVTASGCARLGRSSGSGGRHNEPASPSPSPPRAASKNSPANGSPPTASPSPGPAAPAPISAPSRACPRSRCASSRPPRSPANSSAAPSISASPAAT